MFSVEIRINNTLIGHVHCQNMSPPDEEVGCIYDYEYYDVSAKKLVTGTVRHDREDKIRKLICKIMRDADKKLE